MNKIIILTGVSGVGKSTLAEILKNKHNFKGPVSYCTRSPRDNEENTIHYNFINKENFQQKIQDNFFVEYDMIFDNYYGTSKTAIENILQTNNVIMTLSLKGFLSFKKVFTNNLIGLYLMPPSKEELIKRLNIRNSSTDEIENRLSNICEQSEKESAFFDKVFYPDTIDKIIEKILRFI